MYTYARISMIKAKIRFALIAQFFNARFSQLVYKKACAAVPKKQFGVKWADKLGECAGHAADISVIDPDGP